MNELLNVADLNAGYGARTVLHDVSFALRAGEICAVVGENGSGKTTLLRALALLTPSKGTLSLNGGDLRALSARERALRIGYLAARGGVSLPLNCLEAVLMGDYPRLGALQPIRESERRRALEAMDALGIAQFAERDFLSLSSGERQLVLFARLLIRNTELTLLDEPESALDFNRRRQALSLICRRARETGGGVVLCTHDVNAALRCADRLLTLKDGAIRADLKLAEADEASLREALSDVYGRIDLIRRSGGWLMAEADE